jgi:hypothetical protein
VPVCDEKRGVPIVAKAAEVWKERKKDFRGLSPFSDLVLPPIDTGREPGISSGPGLRFYQLDSRLSWSAWGWRRLRSPSSFALPRR